MSKNNPSLTHQDLNVSNSSTLQKESDLLNQATKEGVDNALSNNFLLPSQETINKKVFYIRHGTTNNKNDSNSLSAQSPYALLSDDGIQEINEAIDALQRLGIKKDDIRLYYSSDTVRIEQTLHIFKQRYGLEDTQCVEDRRLRTTTKYVSDNNIVSHLPMDKQYVEVMTITAEVAQLTEDIKAVDKKYVIILGHKTNKLGAEGVTLFNQKNLDGTFLMATGGILAFDINKNNEYINYKENKDLLHVENMDDFAQIRALFPSIPIEVSIVDFQNQLRTQFVAKKELYSEYFTHSESPLSLRTFCLANLIELKDYITIEKYYLSKECKELSTEEKELFLQNTKDPKIQSILQKLFVCKEAFWGDTDSQIFKNHSQAPFYDLLKQSRDVYKNALELQRKSLDSRISSGGEKAVLPRKFYYEEEKKEDATKENTRAERDQNTKTLVRKDFLPEMFFRDSQYPKYIIRGNVGDGKSMYLSDLAKQYAQESGKMVKFASAKDFDGKEAEITIFFHNPEAILCIDALDEAKAETKMAIVNAFRAFSGHCVITTRYSEFIGEESNIRTLHFHSLDSDVYIDSRFPDDQTKATEVKEGLKKHGLATEVKGNPLLLNLIVILASATEKDTPWMEDYGILQYDQIKAKAALYENVVRFVLIKHVRGMTEESVLMTIPSFEESIIEKTNLDAWMIELGQYAYNISGLSKNNSIKPKKGVVPYFDQYLSFLTKKTKEGNYEFIHKSFYEFFLARHLAKMEKGQGSEQIYNFRDDKKTGNWNDWREFRPVVLFYGEMLAKDGKWENLGEFLGEDGILKNDDMFGENFFMGLEMLCRFPNNILDRQDVQGSLGKYEKKVNKWGPREAIERFEEIKKIMGVIDHLNTSLIPILGWKVLKKNIQDLNDPRMISLLSPIFGTDEILNAAEGINTIGVERDFGLKGDMYIILAESNSSEAINGALKGAKLLFFYDELEHAGRIYIALIKNNCSEAIIDAIKCAEKFFSKKDFYEAGEIYLALAESSIPEAINSAVEGMQKLSNNENFCEAENIYSAIAKNNSPYATNVLNQLTPPIVMVDEIDKVLSMASMLTETITPGSIQKTMEYGLSLLNEGKNRHAQFVYLTLAKKNKHETINGALEGAKILFDRKKFNYAWGIYRVLIRRGVHVAINGAQECAKALFMMGQIPDLGGIYTTLAQYNIPEATNIALEGAKILFDRKKYSVACEVYIALFKSGTIETIGDIKKCVKLLINKQRAYNQDARIRKILITLAEHGSPEATNIALEGAKMLFDKKYFTNAGEIYTMLKGHGIAGAIKCANQLYVNKRYEESLSIFAELFKLPTYISLHSKN